MPKFSKRVPAGDCRDGLDQPAELPHLSEGAIEGKVSRGFSWETLNTHALKVMQERLPFVAVGTRKMYCLLHYVICGCAHDSDLVP